MAPISHPPLSFIEWKQVFAQNLEGRFKSLLPGTSLMVQWSRIHLPVQEMRVPTLLRELRSCMPWGNSVCVPQLEKPACFNPAQPKKKKWRRKITRLPSSLGQGLGLSLCPLHTRHKAWPTAAPTAGAPEPRGSKKDSCRGSSRNEGLGLGCRQDSGEDSAGD